MENSIHDTAKRQAGQNGPITDVRLALDRSAIVRGRLAIISPMHEQAADQAAQVVRVEPHSVEAPNADISSL